MNSQLPPIRMVFEMTREEHPRLFDDLIRFPKGTKRINRLRTLAHDGLLLELGMVRYISQGEAVEPWLTDARQGQLTSQIFEEPLAE